jgi:hypothetical protein
VNAADLREEIAFELEALEAVVNELLALQQDVAHRDPTIREPAAGAAFLGQFYDGIENTLKWICRYHNVPLPTGETWHTELFQRFCSPAYADLPLLFEGPLAAGLAPYRRFRHVAFHSYGFQLDWSRMAGGVANVLPVFEQLKQSPSNFFESTNA